MAEQGCPKEGTDRRVFGKFTCWLQRLLVWESTWEPIPSVGATLIPPYVFANVPLPWTPITKWGVHRVFHVRLGFRYDMNAHIYLLSGAAKTMDRAIMY